MPVSFLPISLAVHLVYTEKQDVEMVGICSCAFEWAVLRLMGVGGHSDSGCALLFCLKSDGTQHYII